MSQFYFVKFSDNIETILADSPRISVVRLMPNLNRRKTQYYTSRAKFARNWGGFIIRTDDSMLICALTLHGNITAVDINECSENIKRHFEDPQ